MSNRQRNEQPDSTWQVGGPIDRFMISLCLYSDDLDPGSLTLALGVEPSRAYRRGDRVSPSVEATRHEGGWILQYRGEQPEEVETGLQKLLASVPAGPAAVRELRRQHRIVLSIGLFLERFNRTFRLSPECLGLILSYGVHEVQFDVWGGGA